MDAIQYRLKHKLDEVFVVEPNELGNRTLNYLFKRLTSYLKVMPFLYILPLSMAASIVLYVLFGTLTVKLVTMLQYGF